MLRRFPFTSDRKRMSVIVSEGEKNCLYIKGADSIILERLAKDERNKIKEAKSFADEASICGYRTLVFAKRELTSDQLSDIMRTLSHADADIINREARLEKICD